MKKPLLPKTHNPEVREILVACRMNVKEMALVRSFAALHTHGDVSKWLRLAMLNYRPKKETKK